MTFGRVPSGGNADIQIVALNVSITIDNTNQANYRGKVVRIGGTCNSIILSDTVGEGFSCTFLNYLGDIVTLSSPSVIHGGTEIPIDGVAGVLFDGDPYFEFWAFGNLN